MSIDKFLLIQLCALSARTIDISNLQVWIDALSKSEKLIIFMRIQTLIFYYECLTMSPLRKLREVAEN